MTAYALVNVACPHCRGHFQERAKLVRPNAQAWCPHCETLFVLDEANGPMRRTLTEAKDARRRRKERIAELKSRWTDTPVQQKPVLMSDVLNALDGLLLRMDALAAKKS